MRFKSVINQKGFWKSVVLLGISFMVIYNIVTMLFEFGEFQFEAFWNDRTQDGKLVRFLIGQVLSALLYGFIISFGQFRNKDKKP